MLGPTLAITCAFTWSLAVILFKKTGDHVHPLLLNFYKNLIGFVLMVPTAYLVEGSFPSSIESSDLAILLVSGLIGIGLADALVLWALKLVGASRMAIVECAYSPFIIMLALLFLGEELNFAQLIGCFFIVAALVVVTVSRESFAIGGSVVRRGMLMGMLGMLSMAAGITMVKPVFSLLPLFWIIAIRLGAGTAGSFVSFIVLKNRRQHLATLFGAHNKLAIFVACVLSTYLSMMLWVAGFKFNDASIAAVLNQTSTIFTVILAALILKERLTRIKVIGTGLAVAGVLLIALS